MPGKQNKKKSCGGKEVGNEEGKNGESTKGFQSGRRGSGFLCTRLPLKRDDMLKRKEMRD
jgi:hypothetical protein